MCEDEKLYIVQSSDNEWWDTKAGYSNFFEFEGIIPPNATIRSVKIYFEHWEEGGLDKGAVKLQVGTGLLKSPDILASQQAPNRSTAKKEQTDVWDVSALVTSVQQVNDLKVAIQNTDRKGKKTKMAISGWKWPTTWRSAV